MKCKRYSIECYLSCKLEKDKWKWPCTCLLVQKRYGKDKTETRETGYL